MVMRCSYISKVSRGLTTLTGDTGLANHNSIVVLDNCNRVAGVELIITSRCIDELDNSIKS